MLSFMPDYFVANIVFFACLFSAFKCIFLSLDCKNSHKWGIAFVERAVILQRDSE